MYEKIYSCDDKCLGSRDFQTNPPVKHFHYMSTYWTDAVLVVFFLLLWIVVLLGQCAFWKKRVEFMILTNLFLLLLDQDTLKMYI